MDVYTSTGYKGVVHSPDGWRQAYIHKHFTDEYDVPCYYVLFDPTEVTSGCLVTPKEMARQGTHTDIAKLVAKFQINQSTPFPNVHVSEGVVTDLTHGNFVLYNATENTVVNSVTALSIRATDGGPTLVETRISAPNVPRSISNFKVGDRVTKQFFQQVYKGGKFSSMPTAKGVPTLHTGGTYQVLMVEGNKMYLKNTKSDTLYGEWYRISSTRFRTAGE